MKWPKSEEFLCFTPSGNTVNNTLLVKNALRGANLRPFSSSGSHRRSPVANLRDIFANLHSSNRDLCIETISTFTATRILRLHVLPLPPGDHDLSSSVRVRCSNHLP